MSPQIYEVLEAESPDDLADMVSNAVAAGKIPCGGIQIFPPDAMRSDDFRYFQAVCSPAALMPAALWLDKKLRKQCRLGAHAKR
jgi:hypothetical protein